MKSGAQIGVAVAAGYVLGRFHKMKWAMALATMAGRKRLASQGGGMLKQGSKLVQSSPELTRLTDDIKGSLMEAGKAAAVAAVGSRINSLSEGLRERSESMRAAGQAGSAGQAGDARDESDGEPDDESDDQAEDETGPETGDRERSRPRREKARARPDGDHSGSRSSGKPARRREAGDGPRPRRRPSNGSSGQRSKRRRETADD